MVVLSGTRSMGQVAPLSKDTAIPWLAPHALCGRYTVPSGPTLTWPWIAPQSVPANTSVLGFQVSPPVSLRPQNAPAAWTMFCEQ